ncbi:unnamed protein product [Vicia faba]|uniref:Vacuolar protein sorting-associated protein 62 n=1 Tax=Vicia faba TaxID=3906 RepID=A0AAV0YY45_VICFA|nr:unnamed protein product [Vicia faba]
MDSCFSSCFVVNLFKRKQSRSRPVDTIFKLPIVSTNWPPGSGFASGIIDLGGIQVSQVSTFNKIWATYDGGQDNQGATVFEPTGIPEGFSMLGSYSQPNNKPLFGYVLVAKDVSSSTSNSTLKKPIDYTLVFNTSSLKVTQDSTCYIWLPIAPDGYKALGHVVTTTQDKPSLDKIKCVRSDLTDQCESSSWIWGSNDVSFFDVRPINRGTQAPGVSVGTFVAQNGGETSPPSISCLKNLNSISKIMPNLLQINSILQAYSPLMYMHPDEEYLPSSVNWFFSNGALLYKKGEESNPVPIAQYGINLPQEPNNDGTYWLDLPADDANKDRVKKGNLQSAESYVHVKPMFGGTFTDIAMWIFYPFNGPGRAKVKFIDIKLGKIGEHVGDWEHVTLRISNLDGKLWKIYFSQHSKGEWIDSSQLEFQSENNSNRPVFYSSLHGHASYPHEGLVLQGKNGIGIRNDSAKSSMIMDLGKFVLVSAEYLEPFVVEPSWLNYFREWGPKIDYDLDEELRKVEKILPWKLKDVFENIIRSLPKEVLGEEGPTGPKVKNNWSGDEV